VSTVTKYATVVAAGMAENTPSPVTATAIAQLRGNAFVFFQKPRG
jgi:hypothetical protein